MDEDMRQLARIYNEIKDGEGKKSFGHFSILLIFGSW